MSLMENGSLSAADIAAVTRNNNGGMFGGYGDGGFFWIIILFLFAIFGNGGWGNNNGGNGGCGCVGQQVQSIIDNQSVQNGISTLAASQAQGFANAEVSRCNMQTNVLQAINQSQAATAAGFNGVTAGLADIKYTVATENCADRNLLQQSTRDVIDNTNNKVQAVMDKLCQLEMDNMKQNYENQIRQLNSENQALRLQASQDAQTYNIVQTLDPTPKPAYVVQNPNCCGQSVYYGGCGCGTRMVG